MLEWPWTTETFLAWEDKQEGKFEFDGRKVILMTGGSFAHQHIVFNLRGILGRLLAGMPFRVAQEMRLRIGNRIRYPDVVVCAGPQDQSTRTITDAVAIFEVLSDDTATTDRVAKLLEYADVPCYAPTSFWNKPRWQRLCSNANQARHGPPRLTPQASLSCPASTSPFRLPIFTRA